MPSTGVDVPVGIDVLVFADGVDVAEAEDLFALAARACRPLLMDLRATFEPVALTATTQHGLLLEARDRVGALRFPSAAAATVVGHAAGWARP